MQVLALLSAKGQCPLKAGDNIMSGGHNQNRKTIWNEQDCFVQNTIQTTGEKPVFLCLKKHICNSHLLLIKYAKRTKSIHAPKLPT